MHRLRPAWPRRQHFCGQRLDLLSRILSSTFEVDGTPVHVTTIAHPTRDEVAVRVKPRRINSSSLHRIAHTNAPQNAVTWGTAMTDSTGNESSSGVDPVLVWQQPHPIYLASRARIPKGLEGSS
jgi:hypothetical protein